MIKRRYPVPVTIVLAAEALAALAYGRMILHRTTPKIVLSRNQAAALPATTATKSLAGDHAANACAKVAFIIARLAPLLPWRADCLVQALAGQTMLRRRAVASKITVGTARKADGTFEAHAWLTSGGAIILGGDITRFEPLLGDGTKLPQSD